MKQTILNFIRTDSVEENIILIDMPPGSGKSYSSNAAIAEYYANGGDKVTIIITPQKKNLPKDKITLESDKDGDLRKQFEYAGIGELYDRITMVLEPVTETALRAACKFADHQLKAIHTFLDDNKLFSDFEAHIRITQSSVDSEQFPVLIENFRKIESRLRRRIHKRIDALGRNRQERYDIIVKEHPWIREMYPAVDIIDKKVLIMSSAKFIYPFDPIIEPPRVFYESRYIKDSIITMDEFDSIKTDWLDHLVEGDASRLIDTINLVSRITEGLRSRDNHMRRYYRIAGSDSNDSDATEELSTYADKVATEFEKLHNKYRLEFDFKLKEEEKKGFIFRGYDSITVGKTSTYSVKCDEIERENGIFSETINNEHYAMEQMFREIEHKLRYFHRFIARLAVNYQEERKQRGNIIPYEYAISSVLEPFKLDDEQKQYLIDVVMFHSNRNRRHNNTNDVSVYSRGFNYSNFEDDDRHGYNTHILQTSFYRTPEAIILKVLGTEGAKIIGISATATIPTCIRNFDLRYLSCHPEYRPHNFTEEEKRALDEMYANATNHYNRTNIHIIMIDGDYKKALGHEAPAALHEIELLPVDEYKKCRYGRFAQAYLQFLKHQDLRSMLCFMTLHPKFDNSFNESTLKLICNKLRSACGFDISEEPFIVLRTGGFEGTREKILSRLSNGDKIFVLTTYQTVGAGQNLQYPVPSDVETVVINDYDNDEKNPLKDFDAIYLDRPTNILPTTFEAGDVNQLATYLFDLEFLRSNLELQSDRHRKNIIKAFNRFSGAENAIPEGMLDLESVRMAAARDIIQATGRMCRTNRKNRSEYVMADIRIADCFDADISAYGPRLNKEFIELHKELAPLANRNRKESVVDGDIASENAKRVISNYVDYPDSWNVNKMESWEQLRNTCLSLPTAMEGDGGSVVYGLYCRLSEPANNLRYRTEGEGVRTTVYTSGKDLNKIVSAEEARLPEILSIPGMREHFERSGYATSFRPNERIMCPILFINIYKGALGEIAGKFIFGQWRIPLKTIADPTKYERFDYVSENGVFVDFKHWKGTPYDAEEKGFDWVFKKLKEVGGERAVIANVLKPDVNVRREPFKIMKDGMTVWAIPYLYDENGAPNPSVLPVIKEVFE